MAKLLRVSKGGQVSLPASVRKRWSTRAVLIEDRGDHVVMRPGLEDPIAAARGAFADRVEAGTTGVAAIRASRDEDLAAERQRTERAQRDRTGS